MALSRLLAFASSARPADIFAVPAVATTARTATHLFMVLVSFLTVHCIRFSAIWPGADCPGSHVIDLFFAEKEPGRGYGVKLGVELGHGSAPGLSRNRRSEWSSD